MLIKNYTVEMRVHLCVCLKQWCIVAEPLADQDGFVIMRGTSHRQLSIFYLKRGAQKWRSPARPGLQRYQFVNAIDLRCAEIM